MTDLRGVPITAVPMALWDLHRSLEVGARVRVELGGGAGSRWPPGLLDAVLEGAGFTVDRVDAGTGANADRLTVWLRRERTLADTVGPGMRLLLVGLNPSLVAADAGVGFHRAGNRAWPALLRAGLATIDRDPADLLRTHRIGMTDLVKRASPRADGLTDAEYTHGVERLDRLCGWLQPGAVCVLGLAGWRRAVDRHAVTGPQPRRSGGRPVYLMPNPSGANAHVGVADLVRHLLAAVSEAEAASIPAD